MLRTLLLATTMLFAVPSLGGVHEDMVALDRAYVPALALTNQPKREPAAQAVARLRTAWDVFRVRYAGAPQGYDAAAWAQGIAEIEASIRKAEASMALGKGPAAHEDLEHVRDAQRAMRRSSGTPYFMDDLTVYHAAMEALAAPATGRTGATITDAEVAAVRAALPPAQRAWQDVVARRGLAAGHTADTETAQAVQRDIDAQSRLLDELDAALAQGHRAAIAEKAQATKPAFSRMFQRFGDFAGLR